MAKEKPDSIQHQAENTIYELHCKGEFEELKDSLGSLEMKADANSKAITHLTAIVTNGLSHKITSIDNRLWAFSGGLILQLVGIILLLVFRK